MKVFRNLILTILILCIQDCMSDEIVKANEVSKQIELHENEICEYVENEHLSNGAGFWGAYNCSNFKDDWTSQTTLTCIENLQGPVCSHVHNNSKEWRMLDDTSCMLEVYDLVDIEEKINVDYTAKVQQRRFKYICDTFFHLTQSIDVLASQGTIVNPIITNHPLFPEHLKSSHSSTFSYTSNFETTVHVDSGEKDLEYELLFGKLGSDSESKYYQEVKDAYK
ncbi:uncharacterized protein LOC113371136 [Ctenocephalides felis]|uniref:uncharacterized protein LOC113371136 n=1 Tax=Ctenocephalides felis TaxID=7515 RepID=UPI000E6E1857|nr:uncharacterized protein LOC113371136 [Ctenocephalides felis]